mmetsp:Transcript_35109/g.71882  ORF Transcript_35109/g.71882 Transcript_35109/m.71882 type:complete len:204 (+) Transcript_35109:583-1194(+)
MASTTAVSSYSMTKVLVGLRMGGGERMVEVSRMPLRLIWSVRGMGVAERVSTSTPLQMSLSRSFCLTPKRCSSSTTSRPRSRKAIPLLRRAWVPITRSTSPLSILPLNSRPFLVFFPIPPLSISILTLKSLSSPILAAMFLKCCAASTPVGASMAACLPFLTHRYNARIATSVFPNPTSPQMSRSIGLDLHTMSFSTCSKQVL